MDNISKAALCALLASLTLSSCGGGGSSSTNESTKVKGLAPRHLVMEGRGVSTITFYGVRYPNPARADGYSAPRDMVMVIDDPGLAPTPTYPTAPPTAFFTFDFGPSEDGESLHQEKVEEQGMCVLSQLVAGSSGMADQANNCVGGIQLRIQDSSTQPFMYICPDFSLEVTGMQESNVTESYKDESVYDPEKLVYERWLHERDVVYTGVVRNGIFTFNNINEEPHSVERQLILNGCQFRWECHEIIVDYANNQEDNPSDPIIGI